MQMMQTLSIQLAHPNLVKAKSYIVKNLDRDKINEIFKVSLESFSLFDILNLSLQLLAMHVNYKGIYTAYDRITEYAKHHDSFYIFDKKSLGTLDKQSENASILKEQEILKSIDQEYFIDDKASSEQPGARDLKILGGSESIDAQRVETFLKVWQFWKIWKLYQLIA